MNRAKLAALIVVTLLVFGGLLWTAHRIITKPRGRGGRGTLATPTPPRGPSPVPTIPPALPPVHEGDEILWSEKSLDEALAEAKSEGKPVFIVFVSGCPACGEMDRKTFRDLRVVAQSRRFVCIRLETASNRAAMSRFGASSAPMIVFLESGLEKPMPRKISGYVGARNLLHTLRRIR